MLQEHSEIENDLSLKEIYNKYLHPEVLPIADSSLWDALEAGSVLNVFQFDSLEGAKTVKKIKPKTIQELTSANGLMRLMGDEGDDRPIEKYVRQKNNIQLWYNEMDREGLTKEEQEIIKPYFEKDYGVPPDQESLMLMLMDKDICHFTLGESNNARKIVGKKQMDKIPILKEKVLSQASSTAMGRYIWKHGASPQMGYAFSRIHSLAYSFIGVQTLYIATHWNPIYWNTACLIVNSGSLEDNSEEEIVDIYEPEASDLLDGFTFEDLPDKSAKKKKSASTNYGKLAKAIGDIRAAGINVALIDINKSDFGFKPDVENNQILFGLKGLLNVNDDLVKEIVANRPYVSPKDFINKIKPKKTAMVSLIKSGAFDNMLDRKLCMAWYLWEICDKKKRLTLQNLPGLFEYNILPDLKELKMPKRIYEFNRYLKLVCKSKTKIDSYILDERALDFIIEINCEGLLYNNSELKIKDWEKVYQKYMDTFRNYISNNKNELMTNLNTAIFKKEWDKYASGTISAWEMEVLCFYYHEHELANIDIKKYGIDDFFKLSEEPTVERVFGKGGKIFKLNKICGTCIVKNKTKSVVTLLTPTGVVNVKLRKEHFALFDKQLSERDEKGVKHRVESSWFNRGNMLIVQGIRSGDDFITKNYKSTNGHQLYKILSIDNNGNLTLTHTRKGEIDNV